MKINDMMAAFQELQSLQELIQPTTAGGEARWNALQQWLQDNPRWQPVVQQILNQPPAEALNALATSLKVDWAFIKGAFPAIPPKAETVIAEIQQMYKERSQQ